MKLKRKTRILLACVVGFAIAMIGMSIRIYLGYCEAYRTEVDEVVVNLCGLSIYRIFKSAQEYAGAGMGLHMGIVCMVCMVVLTVAEELLVGLWHWHRAVKPASDTSAGS